MYSDLAAKDGISLTSAPHKHRDFSLASMAGDYRRVLHRPSDLAWRLLAYSDPDEPLTQTDLQRLEGAAPPRVTPIAPGRMTLTVHLQCLPFLIECQLTVHFRNRF